MSVCSSLTSSRLPAAGTVAQQDARGVHNCQLRFHDSIEVGEFRGHGLVNLSASAADYAHDILEADGQFGKSMMFGNRHVDVAIGVERVLVEIPIGDGYAVLNSHGTNLRSSTYVQVARASCTFHGSHDAAVA